MVSDSLFKQQDAFQVRNFARWLGYLVYLRVVSPAAVLKLFGDLIDQVEESKQALQLDVVLDCILTVLLCEDAKIQIQTACAQNFSTFMNKMAQIMQGRTKFEGKYRKFMGFPEQSVDTIRTKWLLVTHPTAQASSFPLDQAYLMIGKEQQQQIIDALKGKPTTVDDLPKLSFATFSQLHEITFENHLQDKLAPARYLPPHLDVGSEVNLTTGELTAEQTQQYFIKFTIVNLFVDMMIAY